MKRIEARTIEDVRRANLAINKRKYNAMPDRRARVALKEYNTKKEQYNKTMSSDVEVWQADLLNDLLLKIRGIFTSEDAQKAAHRRAGK